MNFSRHAPYSCIRYAQALRGKRRSHKTRLVHHPEDEHVAVHVAALPCAA